MSPKENDKFLQAQEWANKGELKAAYIVIEALWKKNPSHTKYLHALLEILEEIDTLNAFSFFTDLLSGDYQGIWIFSDLSNLELAILLEKHGLLALRLKDECAALDSLQRAASHGRDSLLLWATLSYLFALHKQVIQFVMP